ncbi:alpha/beta hydrolase family protein [Paenibacillus sp. 481]|uniref:alpha/beta hydrolase family protein n=1 Tax=Paenibacillus sp. 481 TaxID=2835869 RepID=UPI001E5DCFA7|nr:hypothetical protein [Paenibacillus sp. 481]UHA73507.1 hypothetical protein KIK04_23640 [Paenibacillus sp. 481]
MMKMKKKHRLRLPSGPNIVGCTSFMFEYVPEENSDNKRIIPCLCFYPATHTGEGKLKKYVNEQILPESGGIETNSYVKAPILEGKHPLLLFNHGYSLFLESNTVQCEELASHGYIVLSIGHQGEGLYALPHGDVLTMDTAMQEDFLADHPKSMELFPAYANWLLDDGKDANLDEHYVRYKELMDIHPRINAHMDVWLKDSLVALESLLNESEQHTDWIANHVDTDQIGAFGMSFGGAAALGLTHLCDLIKASANLDGFYYNSTWHKPIHQPILLMQHDSVHVGPHLMFPFLNAKDDAYLVTVTNSTHLNFTDYNELMAENELFKGVVDDTEVEEAALGEIDPTQMETIMNTLLLDFFNKYLKGMDAQVIDTDDSLEGITLLRK